MAGTDKLIGVLRLDLSQLSAEVEKANKLLKSLGQGVTLDLSAEVMKAVEQKIKTLTDAAEKYGKKMAEVGSQTKQGATIAQSAIQQVTKEVTTLNATTGQIRQVREGFDSLGQKITEVATSAGIISQKISQSFNTQTQAQQIQQLVSLYKQYAEVRAKSIAATYAGKDDEAQVYSQQAAAIRQKIMALEKENTELAKQPQVIQAVANAEEQLAVAQAKVNDAMTRDANKMAQQNSDAKQAAQAYRELRTAVSDYQKAMKAGSDSGKAEAAARIEALRAQIPLLEDAASKLDKQSKDYQEITANIERMKTSLQQYSNLVDHGSTASAAEEAQRKMEQGVSRISSMIMSMLVYRGLRKFWTEAKNFAMDYYNTLKEIQVVTQATDSQMSDISDNFKRMASDLNVSMTEIAKGAVIFYRQGLSTEETENRLSWATKFSKISGSSLEETSQYLTAVLNSMQSLEGNAQRVVDVFTYIGDHAATSGAEIATAMQKAAATADNAGMEFEFLAAAIAAVSATTRQAPETIGTAFNTMMARLHSIKQKGYSEEDETKINDVAKALDKVGIALMDSDGQWRDFDDILTDISKKWDTMSDKQQAYIATTMAGVRAQNYFIALMNDMSKGMEGGSQMWQLYQGSKGSEGVVNSKYETWLTSVEAAQNRLTLAVQKFYDAINAGNFFTGFFNNLAWLVDLMGRGADATNGWAVTGTALIAVIVGIGLAVKNLSGIMAAGGIFGRGGLFATFFNAHPIVAFITAAVAAIGIIAAIAGGVSDLITQINTYNDSYDDLTKTSKEKISEVAKSVDDAKKAQQGFIDQAKSIDELKNRYIELSSKTNLTKEEQAELKGIIDQIISVCPGLRTQINQTTGAFENQTAVVSALNDEILRNYQLAQLAGQHTARTETFGLLAEASGGIDERAMNLQTRRETEDDFAVFLNNLTDERRAHIEDRSKKNGWTFEKAAFAEYLDEWILSEPSRIANNDQAFREFADMYGIYYGAGSNKHDAFDAVYNAHKDFTYDEAQLEQDTVNLINSAQSTLRFFEDSMGLSSGVLENAEKEAAKIYNNVEQTVREGGLTSEYLQEQGEAIQAIYADAHEQQANIEKYNLDQETVERARDKYNNLVAGGATSDEIKKAAKEYNDAAKSFNESYRNATGAQTDIYALIKEGEENLSNATDLVEEQEKSADDIINERRRLRTARESGFSSQREDLLTALYDTEGNIDRKTFFGKVGNIQKNDPLIWKAMMENVDFARLYNSVGQGWLEGTTPSFVDDDTIKKQAEILSQTNEQWGKIAASANDYYDAVDNGTSAIKTTEDAAVAIKEAYEDGGVESAIDKMIALQSNAEGAVMANLLENHPELAAIMNTSVDENGNLFSENGAEFDLDAWLADLNSVIPGTAENFSSLLDIIANTTTTAEDSIAAIDELMHVLNQGSDGQSLSEITGEWANLSKEQQKLLKSLGIDETKFKGLKAGSKELKELKANLQGLKTKNLESLNRVLSGTSKAVESLSKGTKEWTAYQKTLMSSVDTVTKLQGAYDIVLDKSKSDTDEYADAMSYLSQQTGLSAELLGTDGGMAMALSYIQNQTEITQNSVAALANTLLTMSGLNFDASQIVGGYIQLGAGADSAATQVANLVNTALQLLGASISFHADGKGGGSFSVNGVKGQLPTSKTSKGGGGGGGGGSKNSFSDRLSKITEQMGRSVDKYKELLERLSLYESMYSDEGQFTNVLSVLEQRQRVLVDQQKAYERIIADMPQLIKKAKEEVSKYKEGTDKYSTAMKDLQNLEDSYASYTQELIKNRAEQLKNADAIKETREAIIQLESNLRNTIQSVIMDRNNREKASLSARISMEEDVIDAIKNRYEKERDEIIETTELRMQSLNKETEALSDALDERRKLAEDADKQKELETLQDQYARIVADPTRAKEAKEISQKIADLQEEIGWTTAEREVEAQQKIIDQQIQSLEDYQDATNKYYDELLKDPRNFIQEYNDILSGTDAEIINWLTENSDNYVKATDASRKELLQGWQDTLDELRMYTRTVWDEVEAIINLGDTGIMRFLMENSQEFREANEYEQADMVYQWTEMLKDWHAAYVDTFEDLEYMNFTNTVYDWITYLVSQSKASGGSPKPKVTPKKETPDTGGVAGGLGGGSVEGGAEQSNNIGYLNPAGTRGTSWINTLFVPEFDPNNVSRYASGGLARSSGIAYLDGTAEQPERVLSPEQTKTFEQLVDFITKPGMVSVPGLSGGMIPSWQNGGAGAFFGDVNITVESLDSDTDIDNLADKIMDAIDERMTRGMVVGGVAMGY